MQEPSEARVEARAEAAAVSLGLVGLVLSVVVWIYGAWLIATAEGFALYAKIPCLIGWLWYGRTFTAHLYIWVVMIPARWLLSAIIRKG